MKRKNLLSVALVLLTACNISASGLGEESRKFTNKYVKQQAKELAKAWMNPISLAIATTFGGLIWQGSDEKRVYPPLRYISRGIFACFGERMNFKYLKDKDKPKKPELAEKIPYVNDGYANVKSWIATMKHPKVKQVHQALDNLLITHISKQSYNKWYNSLNKKEKAKEKRILDKYKQDMENANGDREEQKRLTTNFVFRQSINEDDDGNGGSKNVSEQEVMYGGLENALEEIEKQDKERKRQEELEKLKRNRQRNSQKIPLPSYDENQNNENINNYSGLEYGDNNDDDKLLLTNTGTTGYDD